MDAETWIAALKANGVAPCIFCGLEVHRVRVNGRVAAYGHQAPVCTQFAAIVEQVGVPMQKGSA